MTYTAARCVLVLTQENDGHADVVVERLRERDVRVHRFHTEDFPLLSQIVGQFRDGRWDGELELPDATLPLSEIGAVWFRRPAEFRFGPELPEVARRFARAEARGAIGGLLRSLDCLWVNHPEKLVTADYKPLQLRIASALGLSVPDSLITNSPVAARRFVAEHDGDVIYKTLRGGVVGIETDDPRSIYTSLLPESAFDELDRVAATPCLFQEYVTKEVELRVTVVGDGVFTAEIDSQSAVATRVDWRRSYEDLTYDVHELPAHVEDACREMVRRLDLEFGAIDLVRTPEGEYVFLEVNPNGQWAWVESATGLPICDAIVDLLERGVTA